MKTFAFMTKDERRFDVDASSAKSAGNKIKSIPHLREKVTGYYYQYDKDGFHNVASGCDGRIEF